MYPFYALASLVLLVSTRLALVQASVYVTNPVQSTTCHGGQSCQVQWIDNGESPLLDAIGECEVGLYTGELELAQSLPSVNVVTSQSFTFTPNPSAGPNGQYYIVFTADSISYIGFSGSFTLDGMTGTTVGGGTSGSSTPTSSPTGTGSPAPSGGSTPTETSTPGSESSTPPGSATPTESTLAGSTPATVSTPATSPTATTPVVTTSSGSVVTLPTSSGSPTTSVSPSATPTNAALRLGSSTSFNIAFVIAFIGASVF